MPPASLPPEFAQDGPFDLVLANILANPLRQLARPMAQHLAPGAQVILSGLLNHQAMSVIAAYRARGLVPLRHLRIEGWSSLLLGSREVVGAGVAHRRGSRDADAS